MYTYNPETEQVEVHPTLFTPVAIALNAIVPITSLVFVILVILFLSNFRFWMRQRYSVPDDCCCDCCVMLFCLPCAITQMYAHVYAANNGCGICSDPGPHP